MKASIAAILIAAALASPAAHSAEWKPTSTVEMVVPTSPGGAADQTGRLVQRLLQDRVGSDITVLNKGGAGGSVAYTYLNQKRDPGHYLSLSTLNLVTNSITGLNPLRHDHVTPICQLYGEYPVIVVKADSQYKSGRDLVTRLRQDPTAASIAFSPGLGGALHLATATVMKAAGVDVKKLKLVVTQSSAESITSLLGGHVEVGVMTPANVVPHLQTGRLRVLGIAAPKRMEGPLAVVPTWQEQGVPGVSASWRGVIGPKGMTADQVRYWETHFAQIVKSDEWKRHLATNARTDEFMGSSETARYYDAQYKELRALLSSLGLAK